MDVRELGKMGLVVVVAAIIIAIGASILSGVASSTCSPGTYVETGVARNDANTSINPITLGKYGCCASGSWNGSACTAWSQTVSVNTTAKGLSSLVVFGDWIPLIALVIVASIVIGVIVSYLGKHNGSV